MLRGNPLRKSIKDHVAENGPNWEGLPAGLRQSVLQEIWKLHPQNPVWQSEKRQGDVQQRIVSLRNEDPGDDDIGILVSKIRLCLTEYLTNQLMPLDVLCIDLGVTQRAMTDMLLSDPLRKTIKNHVENYGARWKDVPVDLRESILGEIWKLPPRNPLWQLQTYQEDVRTRIISLDKKNKRGEEDDIGELVNKIVSYLKNHLRGIRDYDKKKRTGGVKPDTSGGHAEASSGHEEASGDRVDPGASGAVVSRPFRPWE